MTPAQGPGQAIGASRSSIPASTSPPAREAWDALFAGPLAGRTRHPHPLHPFPSRSSRPRRLADRAVRRAAVDDARRMAVRAHADRDVRDAPPRRGERLSARRRLERGADRGGGREGLGPFRARWSARCRSASCGCRTATRSRIGARTWRVVVGSGHSPEHACLVDEAGKLLIAGDQVLPRITSNVSLSLSEPEADPLGEWLASIAKLKRLPDDLLVLPSHGEPFTGLHARLDALAAGHRGRLDALHAFLAEPRRALDCFIDPVRPQDRRRLARPRHRRSDGPSPASRGRGPGGPRGARRRLLVPRRGLTRMRRRDQCTGHGLSQEDVAQLSPSKPR